MSKLKRAMEIPKNRLAKKILGYKEIYSVALRRKNDTDQTFHPAAYSKDYWYADPILFSFEGKDWLFVEAYDRHTDTGEIAVSPVDDDCAMHFTTVLKEPYHLSFPYVFSWNNAIWMIPETGHNHSVNLYRADSFPDHWQKVCEFQTQEPIVDSVILRKTEDRLDLLASTFNEENGLLVKYRKYSMVRQEQAYTLVMDDAFNAMQEWNLKDRNGGPVLEKDGKQILVTQWSNNIDYGVCLSFDEMAGNEKKPVGSMDIQSVRIEGHSPDDLIGIHTYSCTDEHEVIDFRYLHKPF